MSRRSALRAVFAACLLAAPAPIPASAQEAPAYHRVTGVAAGDVLNVRAAPSAGSEILTSLAPGAGPIEVTGTDPSGRWARIAWYDGDGWVSMAYLAPAEIEFLPRTVSEHWPSRLPVGLSCGGTEPFWSLDIETAGRARLHDFATEIEAALAITYVDTARSPDAFPAVLRAGGGGITVTATVSLGACSDGMSDRSYPMSVLMLFERGDGDPHLYEGCCALPLPE